MDDSKGEPGLKLSLRTKLGFGIGDLGGNLFFTAMGFWSLNYLTDVVGMAAAWAGAAIMIGKAWDAVTDPMMGYISDRTRSRWGRRRPWLLIGSVPLLLTMWAFFSAPAFDPGAQVISFIWAVAALCLLNTAYTIVNIPYGALTPELTKDYHQRTVLNGFRFGFAVIGTIIGAAAVQPIASLAGGNEKAGFSLVGLVLGSIMCGTILITFFSVREGALPPKSENTEGFISSYRGILRDKNYLILLLTYALNLTGIAFLQGIIVYYFKYVFAAEGMTVFAFLALLVTAGACVPVSVPLAKRIGKKRCYQLSLLIIAASAMVLFAFGHILGPNFVIAVMVFAGVGIGFGYAPPYSMLPDAIEVEALRAGRRHEGSYYGMWTFTSKVGTALAGMATGLILGYSGYVADAVQGPAALFAMRLILGPIPAAILVAGVLLIQRYPIDEAFYAKAMAGKEPQA